MDEIKYGEVEATEKLNIQPPAHIYGTFARYNYKAWYAIAEFVDNSTASFYQHQKSLQFYRQDNLIVDIIYDSQNDTLKITDNAYGMEIDDFKRAILLNSRPENNSGRNEFGMGLKTAASWFGKVWTVTSTQFNSPRKYVARVDIPKLEREKLNDIDIETYNCQRNEHGTTIFIEQLNRSINGPKTISKIKDILRSMYRRDLASGKITIRWQNEPLKFTPYEVLTSGDKEWRKNVDFFFNFANQIHHVTGFVGILGGSDSGFKKAGFALFRRDRVVLGSEGDYYKPDEIFTQAQSKKSHKLFGELNLDDFQINQAKDGFIWDDGLEDAFLDALKVQISDYIRFASKSIKDREITFDPNNRKEIEETQIKTQESLNKLSKTNEQIVKENVYETDEEKEFDEKFVYCEDNPETLYKETSTTYSIPNGFNNTEDIKVTWSSAGSAYWYTYNKDNNEIIINIEHPFFKPYCSSEDFRKVLQQIVLAIIIAERRAEETSSVDGYAYTDDVNNKINSILKDLTK